MKGLSSRVATNIVWVMAFSGLIIVGTFLTYVTGVLFDDSYEIQVAFPEAGGVLPQQQVTVLGRTVGLVEDVGVTREGVLITLRIDGDAAVPDPAVAQVLRRSPIGEQAVDLRPPDGDGWTPAEPGTTIRTTETIVPAPVPFLLEQTVDLFQTMEVDDVSTIVRELAAALDGRGEVLRRLNRDSLELQRTLVDGLPEFERLIDSSERTLAVLRDHRDTLRSGLRNAADLTEVFAEQRGNVEALLDSGTPALEQVEAFVLNTQANLVCVMEDLSAMNEMLLGPSTFQGADGPSYRNKLHELERALALHRYFFQDGFGIIGQPDPTTGLTWIRGLIVSDEPTNAEFREEVVATPQTRPGAACVTDAFGRGTDAVRQPGVQPPHETAPPIDYAPRVAATSERAEPGSSDPDTSTRDDRDGGSDDRDRGDEVAPVPSDPGAAGSAGEGAVALRPTTDERQGRAGPTIAGIIALLALLPLGAAAWWLRRERSTT